MRDDQGQAPTEGRVKNMKHEMEINVHQINIYFILGRPSTPESVPNSIKWSQPFSLSPSGANDQCRIRPTRCGAIFKDESQLHKVSEEACLQKRSVQNEKVMTRRQLTDSLEIWRAVDKCRLGVIGMIRSHNVDSARCFRLALHSYAKFSIAGPAPP